MKRIFGFFSGILSLVLLVYIFYLNQKMKDGSTVALQNSVNISRVAKKIEKNYKTKSSTLSPQNEDNKEKKEDDEIADTEGTAKYDFSDECFEQTGHFVIADSLFSDDDGGSKANEYASYDADGMYQLAINGDSVAQVIYSMEHADIKDAEHWLKQASIQTGYSDIAALAVIRYLEEASLLEQRINYMQAKPYNPKHEQETNTLSIEALTEQASEHLLTAAKWFAYSHIRNDPVTNAYYRHHFSEMMEANELWGQIEKDASTLYEEINQARSDLGLNKLPDVRC